MDEKIKRWTILNLIDWTADYLKEKGFQNARLTAERLLIAVLKWKRVDLYLNFERPMSTDELSNFKALLKRRLAHEPLQYILGETEFMSLPFKVAPGVLIPRPETELLVERVINTYKSVYRNEQEIDVLDIGTGSGNIAISVARNLLNSHVWAIDISEEALKIAQENAVLNDVSDRIVFKRSDLTKVDAFADLAKYNIVVSNPPYVSQEEYENLPPEIKEYEPKSALWAGEDGLIYYKALENKLRQICKENAYIILELGADMGESVLELFSSKVYSDRQIFNDLADKPRLIQIQYCKGG